MHRTLRIILILITAGGFFFFLLMALGYRFVTRSLPTVSGVIHVAGIKQSAEVYRDDVHIPHILAKSEADLFFAQGFVTAQDRLWQMDFHRRLAAGRLSEIFGSAAHKTDSLMQTVGIIEMLGENLSKFDPRTMSMLNAYTTGVNAYLSSHAHRLPMEFKILNDHPELWKVEDCLAIQALYVWMKDASWRIKPLVQAVVEKIGLEKARHLFPDLEEDFFVTKEQNLQTVSKLEAVYKEGFIPSTSGQDLAWILPGNRTESGNTVLVTRPEYAPIQPALFYEVHLSGAGLNAAGFSLPGSPGILHGHNHHIAWTSVHRITPEQSVSALLPRMQYRILFADKLNEAADFLSKTAGLSLSFLCIDSIGNVWPPIFEQRELPILSNLTGTFAEQRLRKWINTDEKLSQNDIQELLSDRGSILAEQVIARLHAPLEALSTDSSKGAEIKKLFSWDLTFKPGSDEAALFAVFLENCLTDLWIEPLGKTLLAAYARLDDIPLNAILFALENKKNQRIIKSAWLKSVDQLHQRFGTDMNTWSWGAYQQIVFRHPIRIHPFLSMVYDIGPFAIGGSNETVEGISRAWDKPSRVIACPSARLIIAAGTWQSRSILPSGQSGQPLDAHYSDQIQGFLSNQFHPNITDSLRIVHSGWEHLTLTPEDENEKKHAPQYPEI